MNITCIIPARNAEATLERAVISALNAGCSKVLMYDDGSTDSTFQKMIDINKAHRTQTFYYNHGYEVRAGVNYARNFLVGQVFRSLIIPLDSDDELLDITPFIEAYEDSTWVYGDHIECDGSNETYHKGAPAGGLARKIITGVTCLYSHESWYRAGGYDPDFAWAEDYAFQCALTHHGIRPVYVPQPLYRRHLKPEGNERTILAGHYWPFYHTLARTKWPSVFT